MQSSQQQKEISKPSRELSSSRQSKIVLTGGFAFLAAFALFTGAALPGQQTPSADKPYQVPEASRLPDAPATNNQMDQMKMGDSQDRQQSLDAANAERKKQLSDDSAKLLTLAVALKAEVDKTNKDMLSLNVIRKADEIEKLAHTVKEKMKLTTGGS
jgi:hypothetical protein